MARKASHAASTFAPWTLRGLLFATLLLSILRTVEVRALPISNSKSEIAFKATRIMR